MGSITLLLLAKTQSTGHAEGNLHRFTSWSQLSAARYEYMLSSGSIKIAQGVSMKGGKGGLTRLNSANDHQLKLTAKSN